MASLDPKKIAIALFEATENKTESEVKVCLVNFFKLLEKNSNLAALPKILQNYLSLVDLKSGIIKANLKTAQPISDDLRSQIVELIIGSNKDKQVELVTEIDKNLLGGFILQYDNKLINASLANRLEALQRYIAN